MKKFCYLLFVFMVGWSSSLAAQGLSADTVQQIDALFTRWHNGTPGAVITVARGTKIVYNRAIGLADLEHNIPNTTETIFESGSVAKQFTAAAILLLAKEGKLSLNDDIRKYVPEIPVYQKTITIQHLLNHTSGLKDWGVVGSLTGWPRTTRVYTQELALQIMSRQKSTNFVPGNEYSYSNANYSMLVTIVERVAKQSLATFTHQRFFEPLGMKNTQWRNNFREVVPNRAVAYQRSNGQYEQLMPFEHIHGHGGLLTTTTDLIRWNQLLETQEILGDEAAAWRTTPGQLNNGTRIQYAAGLNVRSHNGFKEISHSGATAGYRAWLAYYPDKKLSVALLSNDAGFNPVAKGYEIAAVFLGEEANPKPVAAKAVLLSEQELKRWAGVYRSIRGFDFFSMEYKNGHIESNGYALTPLHRDTLTDGRLKWIWSANRILVNNSTDTTSYVRVPIYETSDTYLKAFEGLFHSTEADMTYHVESKEGNLWIHRAPHPSIELKPVFEDGFRDEDFTLYEFRKNKSGKVVSMEVSQSRALRVPFNKMTYK